MGVTILPTSVEGELTPICNICGICEEWTIDIYDYNGDQLMWDNWICKYCRREEKYNDY